MEGWAGRTHLPPGIEEEERSDVLRLLLYGELSYFVFGVSSFLFFGFVIFSKP